MSGQIQLPVVVRRAVTEICRFSAQHRDWGFDHSPTPAVAADGIADVPEYAGAPLLVAHYGAKVMAYGVTQRNNLLTFPGGASNELVSVAMFDGLMGMIHHYKCFEKWMVLVQPGQTRKLRLHPSHATADAMPLELITDIGPDCTNPRSPVLMEVWQNCIGEAIELLEVVMRLLPTRHKIEKKFAVTCKGYELMVTLGRLPKASNRLRCSINSFIRKRLSLGQSTTEAAEYMLATPDLLGMMFAPARLYRCETELSSVACLALDALISHVTQTSSVRKAARRCNTFKMPQINTFLASLTGLVYAENSPTQNMKEFGMLMYYVFVFQQTMWSNDKAPMIKRLMLPPIARGNRVPNTPTKACFIDAIMQFIESHTSISALKSFNISGDSGHMIPLEDALYRTLHFLGNCLVSAADVQAYVAARTSFVDALVTLMKNLPHPKRSPQPLAGAVGRVFLSLTARHELVRAKITTIIPVMVKRAAAMFEASRVSKHTHLDYLGAFLQSMVQAHTPSQKYIHTFLHSNYTAQPTFLIPFYPLVPKIVQGVALELSEGRVKGYPQLDVACMIQFICLAAGSCVAKNSTASKVVRARQYLDVAQCRAHEPNTSASSGLPLLNVLWDVDRLAPSFLSPQ